MRILHVSLCCLVVGCACTNPSRSTSEASGAPNHDGGGGAESDSDLSVRADGGVDAAATRGAEVNRMHVTVGSRVFAATLFDNATARAFAAMLPLSASMKDVNANEKYVELPSTLPGNAANPGTIQTGDLMLYGSNGLVLFYKTFPTSYPYTRIGTIDDPTGLAAAVGAGT